MIRGIAAIVAGLVVFSALLVAMTAAAGPVQSFGSRGMVLWVGWQVVSMTVAGVTIASIARRAPATHAVATGVLQMLLTLWAFVAVREPSSPAWFWVAGMIVMPPAAWLGARVRSMKPGPGARPQTPQTVSAEID